MGLAQRQVAWLPDNIDLGRIWEYEQVGALSRDSLPTVMKEQIARTCLLRSGEVSLMGKPRPVIKREYITER